MAPLPSVWLAMILASLELSAFGHVELGGWRNVFNCLLFLGLLVPLPTEPIVSKKHHCEFANFRLEQL